MDVLGPRLLASGAVQLMVGFIVVTMFFTMRTVYLFRPPAVVQQDPQVVADSAAVRCVPARRTPLAAPLLPARRSSPARGSLPDVLFRTRQGPGCV